MHKVILQVLVPVDSINFFRTLKQQLNIKLTFLEDGGPVCALERRPDISPHDPITGGMRFGAVQNSRLQYDFAPAVYGAK